MFLLVSVDSFRKTAGAHRRARRPAPAASRSSPNRRCRSSTISTRAEGREAAGLDAAAGRSRSPASTIFSLRLRPGDDASCLNLYQPKQPRIVGVPDRARSREGRFRFARTIAADDDADAANPWTLLGAADADGVVPAIVDATSLQYVLHAAVGDVITIDADTRARFACASSRRSTTRCCRARS